MFRACWYTWVTSSRSPSREKLPLSPGDPGGLRVFLDPWRGAAVCSPLNPAICSRSSAERLPLMLGLGEAGGQSTAILGMPISSRMTVEGRIWLCGRFESSVGSTWDEYFPFLFNMPFLPGTFLGGEPLGGGATVLPSISEDSLLSGEE